MIVVIFVLILFLLAVFILLLPYILVAAAIGIPIYVTHRIIKQHRKKVAAAIWKAKRARRLTASQRYRELSLIHI